MCNHVENIYLHNQYINKQFIILSGPSAGGKTFLSKKIANYTDKVCLLIKHTDRNPREGEINGIDYFFMSTSLFKDKINPNTALVSVSRYEHLYGLSCEEVDRALKTERIPLFILDPHAAIKFKEIYNKSILIFVGPPLTLAKKRLLERSEDSIEKKKRIELIDEEYSLIDRFNIVINNDYSDNDLCVLINSIMKGERL